MENIISILAGIFILLLLPAAAFIWKQNNEILLRIISALGTVCILASGINIMVSLREVNNQEHSLFGRILAVICSFGGFLAWVWVYLTGLAIL